MLFPSCTDLSRATRVSTAIQTPRSEALEIPSLMKEKTILKLKLNTDPRWVDIASKNIVDILVDHA